MKRTSLLLALAASAALSACVVVPAHRGYVYDPGPAVVVDVPPPAPYVEELPAMPYPGAVWISGYWGWRGSGHQWVRGHYERPQPGYRYEPHRWENQGGRWRLRGGAWVRF